jgi:serine/threonine protein kinase
MNDPPTAHANDQTLRSFALGKLDHRSAEAVNEHLMQCGDCRRRVAALAGESIEHRAADAQKPSRNPMPAPAHAGAPSSGKVTGKSASRWVDTLPPELAEHPDYEVKKELGHGGMGVVFLAHNRLMGRDEVLKVMARQIMERPGVLDRFLREIRAVARLRHPNIVTAYSAFRLGESIVFAMEYVEGLDLARTVKAKGPLPVAHACNFVYQAALGLQHAHEEGLVHRDIKPANLMLARKGERPVIKILDFGLAKAAREEKVDAGLTMEGQALGTPDYIAPEQIIDAPSADIRADIYSLGATLYYLLTGHAPFQAKSLYDLYQAHISLDADPLNLVRPEVPAELAALVAKLMSKDPARRFQTPGEVALALAPFCKKGSASGEIRRVDASQAGPASADRSMLEADSAEPTVPTAVDKRNAPPEEAGEPGSRLAIDVLDPQHPAGAIPGAAPQRVPTAMLTPARVAVVLFAVGLFTAGLVGLLIRNTGRDVAIEAQRHQPTARRLGPTIAVEKSKRGEDVAGNSAVVSGEAFAVDTGRNHPGTTDGPREAMDSKSITEALSRFTHGLNASSVNTPPVGLGLAKEHLGRVNVLRTQPIDLQTPFAFRSLIEVPAGKTTTLALDVAHHPEGVWRLIVKASGEVLHDSLIGAATTGPGWSEINIDLSRFAGRTIWLELLNQSIGGRSEYAYWGGAAVTSEPRAETGRLADGFIPLFNGQNFEGWTSEANLPIAWEVREGAIHSTLDGRIHTKRADYSDFHLRAELRAGEKFFGHLFFRSDNLPGRLNGYGVWITTAPVPRHATTARDHATQARTGSLVTMTRQPPSSQLFCVVDSDLIRPNEWFTLELTAVGAHFAVKLNGREVVEADDPDQTFKQGRIGLHRMAGPAGEIECRKIEIKELPPGESAAAAPPISVPRWVLRPGFPVVAYASTWSYTLTDPGRGWSNPNFDDRSWKSGQAPFGTPGPEVKTPWLTPDIWLHRRVVMPTLNRDLKLFLYVRHDDDVEIHVNGKPLYYAAGSLGFYTGFPLSPAQVSLFRAGSNALAVHGRNATPEQLIDVGLRLVPAPAQNAESRTARQADPPAVPPTTQSAPDIMHDGAFAFPQLQAKVLCHEPGLRLSVWNDSQFLYVQAVVQLDDDDAPARPAGGDDDDKAYLLLDVDSDMQVTEWHDRVYGLLPTLSYQTYVGKNELTTIRGDSKGRGAMRLLPDGKGGWIRVDSFAIPLSEIERKPGETIRLAYWADSARLKSPVNANGVRRQGHYRFSDLPYSRYHTVLLSHRPAILDVSKVPEDR